MARLEIDKLIESSSDKETAKRIAGWLDWYQHERAQLKAALKNGGGTKVKGDLDRCVQSIKRIEDILSGKTPSQPIEVKQTLVNPEADAEAPKKRRGEIYNPSNPEHVRLWQANLAQEGRTMKVQARKEAAAAPPPKRGRARAAAPVASHTAEGKPAPAVKAPRKPRTATLPGTMSSKQQKVIELMKQKDGVSIQEVMDATEWLSHSVQGFFSGVVKTKLGYKIEAHGTGKARRYKIIGGGPQA